MGLFNWAKKSQGPLSPDEAACADAARQYLLGRNITVDQWAVLKGAADVDELIYYGEGFREAKKVGFYVQVNGKTPKAISGIAIPEKYGLASYGPHFYSQWKLGLRGATDPAFLSFFTYITCQISARDWEYLM
jgi:hypothetical protein